MPEKRLDVVVFDCSPRQRIDQFFGLRRRVSNAGGLHRTSPDRNSTRIGQGIKEVCNRNAGKSLENAADHISKRNTYRSEKTANKDSGDKGEGRTNEDCT